MHNELASMVELLLVEPSQASIDRLAKALARLLCEREAPVFMPVGPGEDQDAIRDDLAQRLVRLPADVRLIMRTSGSTTGHGRLVGLSAAELRASIRATDQRLGGPARWLLALPAHHIAGLQVVARCVLDGMAPLLVTGLDADSLTEAIDHVRAQRSDARVNLSLVPSQLHDLLADEPGRQALRGISSVLVGGAATETGLIAQAQEAGIHLHLSYGMTETCGGCVYDGKPLRGVDIAVGDRPDLPHAGGPIWLSGPMLMTGYLDGDAGIDQVGGRKWLKTHDLGSWQNGRLLVCGRADDVIITGGLKVNANDVREAVLASGLVQQAAILSLPHPRWGQLVTAVVVPGGGWSNDNAVALRNFVGSQLSRQLAPRVIVATDRLPTLASGKLDRVATRRLAEHATSTGAAWTVD